MGRYASGQSKPGRPQMSIICVKWLSRDFEGSNPIPAHQNHPEKGYLAMNLSIEATIKDGNNRLLEETPIGIGITNKKTGMSAATIGFNSSYLTRRGKDIVLKADGYILNPNILYSEDECNYSAKIFFKSSNNSVCPDKLVLDDVDVEDSGEDRLFITITK